MKKNVFLELNKKISYYQQVSGYLLWIDPSGWLLCNCCILLEKYIKKQKQHERRKGIETRCNDATFRRTFPGRTTEASDGRGPQPTATRPLVTTQLLFRWGSLTLLENSCNWKLLKLCLHCILNSMHLVLVQVCLIIRNLEGKQNLWLPKNTEQKP